jgi:hypothetical protein
VNLSVRRATEGVMKHAFAILILSALSGCGPLSVPGVRRLAADEQAVVDGMWDNMLSPPARLDRDVLLDTIVSFELLQTGVDRLTMRSEKHVAAGKVVMVVRFDRRDPSADTFAVELLSGTGAVLRSERYSREEVFAHAQALRGPPGARLTASGTQPSETPEERSAREAYERRIARVAAATQRSAER